MTKFYTSGVCAKSITFAVSQEGLVTDIAFEGGCHGNAQGIAQLAEGRSARDIIQRLSGICCKGKPTSCPDQLALALQECTQNLHQPAPAHHTAPTTRA